MPTPFISPHATEYVATESVNPETFSLSNSTATFATHWHSSSSITVDDEKTAVAEEIKLANDFERADLPDSVKSSSNGSAREQVSRKSHHLWW